MEFKLGCPLCGAEVDYEDLINVEEDPDSTRCPECSEEAPTSEWFD